jgi:hypothetical protein
VPQGETLLDHCCSREPQGLTRTGPAGPTVSGNTATARSLKSYRSYRCPSRRNGRGRNGRPRPWARWRSLPAAPEGDRPRQSVRQLSRQRPPPMPVMYVGSPQRRDSARAPAKHCTAVVRRGPGGTTASNHILRQHRSTREHRTHRPGLDEEQPPACFRMACRRLEHFSNASANFRIVLRSSADSSKVVGACASVMTPHFDRLQVGRTGYGHGFLPQVPGKSTLSMRTSSVGTGAPRTEQVELAAHTSSGPLLSRAGGRIHG